MSDIEGIFVSLQTGAQWFGTDDHIYLGVVGTVGGREFALAVDDFDDFEPGDRATYSIGPAAEIFGGREPDTAAEQLDSMTICLPNVTHVYLRKQGDRSHAGDDAWELQSCFVYLLGGSTRAFTSTGSAILGNEYGHKVWLAEGIDGYVDARIPVEGEAECE
jgi:hypothetical protein